VKLDPDSTTVTALGLAGLGFLLGLVLEWQFTGSLSGELGLILATAGAVWPILKDWEFY
jgi:hypothetical protein